MSNEQIFYGTLADWWHLLSPVEEYAEEAAKYVEVLQQYALRPITTLLELGSGGGNNAWHMKQHFKVTLADVSEHMLRQSKAINPACEHLNADMRTARLGRTFDGVFIHDAIDYMTNIADLRSAMVTAFAHCEPGGVALFAPDHTRETFAPDTDHGGDDGPDRALRYLEWTWDPNPDDEETFTDYTFVRRNAAGEVKVDHERHVHGLFTQQQWLDCVAAAGFEPRMECFQHSDVERPLLLFIGVKPEP